MVSARMEPSGRSSPSDLIDFLTDLERRDVACETGGAGAPLTPSEIPQTETMSLLPFLGLEELDLLQGSLEGIGGSRPDLPPFSPPAPSYVEESHSASEDLELVPPRRGASQRPPENPKSPDKSSSDATKALFWASILQAQMCVLDLQGEIDRQMEPMRSSSLSPEKVLGTPPSQDSATSHEPLLLESDSGEEAEEDSERQEEEEEEGSLEEEEEEEEVECLFYNNPLFCASPRTISAEGPALLGHLEEKASRKDGDGIPTGGVTSRDCAIDLLCQADVATDSRLLPEPDPGGDPPPGPYPSYVPHYRSLSPLVITEGELESASPVAEEKELPPSIVPSLDTPHKAQGFFPDLSPHTLSSSDLDQIAPPDIDLPAQEGLLFSACSTSLVTAFLQEPLERYPAPNPPSPAEISWASSSLQVPAAAAAAEPSRWQEEQKPQAPSCDHALPLCAWVEEPRRTSCLQEEAAAADLHPDSLGGAEGKLEGSTEGLEMPMVDGDGTLEDEDQEEEEEEETATFHPPEEPPSGNGTDVGKETPPSKEQAEPNGILQANGSAPPADQAAALRLATRLYHLDGFKKSQVASFLRKNNDFSRLVREAYLSFFHFSGQTLDEALRSFLKAFVLTGETQERERILRHFSQRYHNCNPEVCLSPDAVHTLTCAIMLLNTDLHGQNIGRSMTCQAFLTNLDGLNDDGKNFPKDLLKALYHSIRQEKLEWAADDDEEEPPSSATPLSASSQKKANPFLTLSHDPEAKIYRQGLLARKVHAEADGKKTPWGKRGWKMFHTVLKGMVLYFSKDESRPDASASEEPIGVHHALAEKASKYTKRPHVFRLQTADWRVFLFQAPTAAEMSSWVSRINLVAAMFSSPPFPAAVGSQRKFIRPVLPTAPCKNSLEDQHFTHESWMDQVSDDLLEHQRNLPSKRGRGRDLEEYQLKKEYLLYEKRRYETYVRLLEVKLAGEDTEDLEQWEARLGEAGELPAEEGCPSLQKSHSSPSLNVDGLPGGVKVKRNISERRTVRKIIPRRNKHLL